MQRKLHFLETLGRNKRVLFCSLLTNGASAPATTKTNSGSVTRTGVGQYTWTLSDPAGYCIYAHAELTNPTTKLIRAFITPPALGATSVVITCATGDATGTATEQAAASNRAVYAILVFDEALNA